jgi:hypothetical protein
LVGIDELNEMYDRTLDEKTTKEEGRLRGKKSSSKPKANLEKRTKQCEVVVEQSSRHTPRLTKSHGGSSNEKGN